MRFVLALLAAALLGPAAGAQTKFTIKPADTTATPPAPAPDAPVKFTIKPVGGRPGYDPYHAKSYKDFVNMLAGGHGPGILYVGVPDASVGTYDFHYSVPAGFGGLASGVYDCRFDEETDQPKMTLRTVVVQPPAAPAQEVRRQAPFRQEARQPSTRGTGAGPADTSPVRGPATGLSAGGSPTDAIFMNARTATGGGHTRVCLTGG